MLIRPRRNRRTESIRKLSQENRVTADDFIMPLFIVEGSGIKEAIESLPVAYRRSLDEILIEIKSCLEYGLHSFILFPKISDANKDKTGTYSYDKNNFYLKAAKEIKKTFPQITLISDVALDPYSIDGHDGIVYDGVIDNDSTLDVLVKMSIAQAKAGFDVLGPSDMMDGRIAAIREGLDNAGYINTGILSYTAKYASGFYGPFRDALDSAPIDDDSIPKHKKSYQMNPSNSRVAITEAELDILEGADYLMVKPAIHYLDIIRQLKDNFSLPIAAYHVSGECAMLIAACENGWLDYEVVMPETLLSIKRAGADIIITYFAKEYLQLQRKKSGR
jgi:porphobilinogen synthase